MYDSARLITSRRLSGFHGYPMPEKMPDYLAAIFALEERALALGETRSAAVWARRRC